MCIRDRAQSVPILMISTYDVLNTRFKWVIKWKNPPNLFKLWSDSFTKMWQNRFGKREKIVPDAYSINACRAQKVKCERPWNPLLDPRRQCSLSSLSLVVGLHSIVSVPFCKLPRISHFEFSLEFVSAQQWNNGLLWLMNYFVLVHVKLNVE